MYKKSLFAALSLFLLLAVAACGTTGGNGAGTGNATPEPGGSTSPPASSGGAPVAGGTLTIGAATEPSNLDPGRDPGGPEQNILYSVVETLVMFDTDMELVPAVAASLPEVSEDGTVYTFTLREGQVFHDGEPVDAAAVKFTFDRVMGKIDDNPGAYQNLVSGLEEVEVVDPLTVRFILDSPSATFLTNITHLQFGIISPKAFQSMGEAFARQPIGSGPFRLESWEAGQQIVMVKNDQYRVPGVPLLDKVVYRILPDASTRIIALESGEIDVLLDLPESEYVRLQSDPNLQLYAEPTLRTVFYLFSPEQFPFGDQAVREAFALAVDREAIANTVLEGMHLAATRASFNPTVWGVTDNLPVLDYDLDQARAVLDAAGWTVGSDGVRSKDGQPLKFTLWTTTNRYPRDKLLTEFVAQTLKEIGMDVDVQTMEWAAYREQLYKREMPAFLFGAGSSTGDIDFVASALFNSNSRFTQHTTPEIETLLEDAKVAVVPADRLALYDEAFTRIHDLRLWIPVYWQSTLAAARTPIHDFSIHPTERIVVQNAWKE